MATEERAVRDLILSKWAGVRDGLFTAIEAFLEDELDFRPAISSYSVGETMLHIAHEEDIEVRFAILRELREVPPPYEAHDLTTIKAILTASHERALAYLRSADDTRLYAPIEAPWGGEIRPVDMLWHIIEHEVHHRGELSLMLGLLGRTGIDA